MRKYVKDTEIRFLLESYWNNPDIQNNVLTSPSLFLVCRQIKLVAL